ncbi:MAG: NUDIX hydrolase [Silicimonas sp.]|nr:NUDIX hydrolase [Silicimonas sp.]
MALDRRLKPVTPLIRDAATVILVRDAKSEPSLLMGQRGATAAFMPDKYVFPGGAVDDGDAEIPLVSSLSDTCAQRLQMEAKGPGASALATAAIRELWEETGQCLGEQGVWTDAPDSWSGFANRDLRPSAGALSFFFRALTPPGRPRRFDARFFLADAAALATDPDDFTNAEAELTHLHWVPVAKARELNLPFITRIVLAELESHLPNLGAPDRVPFVKNEEQSEVIWL